MENNYLHKIDVKTLLKETGLTLNELAKESGISRSNNLKKWEKDKDNGGARPSFNTFIKLLQKGATVETLFGVEYAKMHPTQGAAPSEFLEGLKESNPESALNAIVERKVLEMKANGKI